MDAGLTPPLGSVQSNCSDATNSKREPIQIHVAALVAQQAALAEEEARLDERRLALIEKEEQLAAYMENKRQNVLLLRDRVREESNALDERRQRLLDLGRRLRARWQRTHNVLRAQLAEREQNVGREERRLNDRAQRVDERQTALDDARLRFNALYELGRRSLREAWLKLRQQQARWRHRRGKERAALKVRDLDLEAGERQLAAAQRLFLREKKAWDQGKARLMWELLEADRRVQNQRALLMQRQLELQALDSEIHLRTSVLERLHAVDDQIAAAYLAQKQIGDSLRCEDSVFRSADTSQDLLAHREPERFPSAVAAAQLEHLAGELADQRWQLLQTWQNLETTNQRRQAEYVQAHRELQASSAALQENARKLAQREDALHQGEAELRREEEALILLRQHLLAWNIRLKTRENVCEAERRLALEAARRRELLVERHLRLLGDLRQSWTKRRRQELELLQRDRNEVENSRRANAELRRRLVHEIGAISEEKKTLTEKALALEQFRQEMLKKKPSSQVAERRLERLRRRWFAHNEEAVRTLTRYREELAADFADLDSRRAELRSREEQLTATKMEFEERQSAAQYERDKSNINQGRLNLALEEAEKRRNDAEQHMRVLRDEVERIARSLLDEPEPRILPMNQAA